MSGMLTEAIAGAVERHGSYRAAAKVLGTDHAYLHKLATGNKNNPSDVLLRKLGLRRTVTITYSARITMSRLLRCPFCGDAPKLHLLPGNKHGSGSCDIECQNPACCAAISIGGDGETGQEAIAAWNRRTPAPAVEAERDECDECADTGMLPDSRGLGMDTPCRGGIVPDPPTRLREKVDALRFQTVSAWHEYQAAQQKYWLLADAHHRVLLRLEEK